MDRIFGYFKCSLVVDMNDRNFTEIKCSETRTLPTMMLRTRAAGWSTKRLGTLWKIKVISNRLKTRAYSTKSTDNSSYGQHTEIRRANAKST